jgi:septal ring factor EnvC (AmiA/AmiB activator)
MTFSRLLLLFQAQYRIPDIVQNVSPPSDAGERKERGQMSEERIVRLENAMATLAEISAQHNERLAAAERTAQTLRELAADHQQLLANMQRRVTGLEETNVTLVELLQRHHDGITELRAAQANSDAKIAILAESQAYTDRRLDALIDIVRGGRNGPPES